MRFCGILECNEDGDLSFRRVLSRDLPEFDNRRLVIDLEVADEVLERDVPDRIAFGVNMARDLREQLWQLDELPHFLMPDRIDDFELALAKFLAFNLTYLPAGGPD